LAKDANSDGLIAGGWAAPRVYIPRVMPLCMCPVPLDEFGREQTMTPHAVPLQQKCNLVNYSCFRSNLVNYSV
jgi:hypothetical protein